MRNQTGILTVGTCGGRFTWIRHMPRRFMDRRGRNAMSKREILTVELFFSDGARG